MSNRSLTSINKLRPLNAGPHWVVLDFAVKIWTVLPCQLDIGISLFLSWGFWLQSLICELSAAMVTQGSSGGRSLELGPP